MIRTRRKRVALFSCGTVLLLLLIPVGLTAFALYRQQRQDRLNHNLIAAVKANDDRAVVSLLQDGADANCRDEPPRRLSFWQTLMQVVRGRKSRASDAPTPLLIALMWKDQRDRGGAVAIPPQNIPLIRALIENGADPNRKDELGRSPLFFAINETKVATIHFLLAHGADAKKYDPHYDPDFQKPLVDAASECPGHPDVLEDLLDHGANVNQRESFGDTALFTATTRCDSAAVKLLLTHHADVSLKGSTGETPLVYAMKYFRSDSLQITRMLKQTGAKQ